MSQKNPAKPASDKDVLVAINNAISLLMGSENGPPKDRLRRLAHYTRAFYAPMRESLLEDEMLRPAEAVSILLSMALLVQQSVLVEAERKVPAQAVLEVLFKEDTASDDYTLL